MPIQEEKRNRMARALIKIVHECDAGMKQGVGYYRNALVKGDTAEALELLKRAARLPYRVESRVQGLVAKHTAAAVNAALSQVSSLSLADLQAELNPLKTYSDVLKDNFQNQGWTPEQIAVDIETNRADLDHDEAAPIPNEYTDDF